MRDVPKEWARDRVWRFEGLQQGVFNLAQQIREYSMEEVVFESGFGARLR